jgi:hypothetical protein
MAMNDVAFPRRTYHKTAATTTTAASVTMPGPNASHAPAAVLLRPAPSNTDIIYVATVGAADATGIPIRPGDAARKIAVPGPTLSAMAASGSQTLEIEAQYA